MNAGGLGSLLSYSRDVSKKEFTLPLSQNKVKPIDLYACWKFKLTESMIIGHNQGSSQISTLILIKAINPFHANVPFLYALKKWENKRFSDVFWGYRNGTLAWKGLINFYFSRSHYKLIIHLNSINIRSKIRKRSLTQNNNIIETYTISLLVIFLPYSSPQLQYTRRNQNITPAVHAYPFFYPDDPDDRNILVGLKHSIHGGTSKQCKLSAQLLSIYLSIYLSTYLDIYIYICCNKYFYIW